MKDSASQLLVLLTQAPAKHCATDAGADSAPAKPCAIYNCMKDSASRLAVLLDTGSCETLGEMEMYEQFKQSAQALELLHKCRM